MAYETNPLLALWYALPPNVRQQYTSGLKAAGELSPGAAVRDVVDESGKMVDAAKSGNWVDAASGPAKMAVAALGVIPGTKAATKAIRAYHGSPHSFDKFDLNKIGTGEGAQAYGHGLYFAENEGVARGYRDALAPDAAFNAVDSLLLRNRGFNLRPEEIVQRLQGTPAAKLAENPEAVEAIRRLLPQYIPNAPVMGSNLGYYRTLNDAAEKAVPGHMYEVNLHADPAKMLDWDKRLSEQPSIVQDLARNADLSHLKPGNRTRVMLERFKGGTEDPNYTATGHTLHNVLSDYGAQGNPALSQYLHQQGIPAIKYLDQGSRGWTVHNTYKGEPYGDPLKFPTQQQAAAYAAEQEAKGFGARVAQEGTSNYVVFSPEIIEIMRKYGLLPATVAAGATGAATVPGLLAPNDKVAY